MGMRGKEVGEGAAGLGKPGLGGGGIVVQVPRAVSFCSHRKRQRALWYAQPRMVRLPALMDQSRSEYEIVRKDGFQSLTWCGWHHCGTNVRTEMDGSKYWPSSS